MGSKRLSISQMEKQQATTTKKKGKDDKKGEKSEKKGETRIFSVEDKAVLSDVAKMKAITAYSLSSAYGIRLSLAKDALEELERRDLVRLVGGNSRIRIYTPQVQQSQPRQPQPQQVQPQPA